MAPPTMEAGNSVVTFNLLATPESKEIMFNLFRSRTVGKIEIGGKTCTPLTPRVHSGLT